MNAAQRPNTDNEGPSFSRFVVLFVPRLIALFLLSAFTLPLWLLYWLGQLIWYRPPNVPRADQVRRYLSLTWTVQPPDPGLPFFARVWITLSIYQKWILTPVLGLAWLVDEMLYGRTLDEVEVHAPFFVISAGRSGSTQITRYLEADPSLEAPNIIQCMFPYLWLWRLAPRTIGRLISPEKVRQRIQATMPPELWERHEADPFKVDTFDGAFYSFHMNQLALSLGPETAVSDFNLARFEDYDRQTKERDFVDLVDRLARKTLLNAGTAPEGLPRHFLLKGHFLYAAQALSERYPDACFLTVIREPASRLRSAVNYMRVNPSDPVLGPTPWTWLGMGLSQTETDYCIAEMAWFTEETAARCCVIRFTEFVSQLRPAMEKVYRCCFESAELPAHIPSTHPPRERKHYSVNRSLGEIGIDEAAYRERLKKYIEWCQ